MSLRLSIVRNNLMWIFYHVWLFVTLWTIVHQAPLSMGFFRQEYWSGLPCPPPRNLPDPGIEPVSLVSLALAGRLFTTEPLNWMWGEMKFSISKIFKQIHVHFSLYWEGNYCTFRVSLMFLLLPAFCTWSRAFLGKVFSVVVIPEN